MFKSIVLIIFIIFSTNIFSQSKEPDKKTEEFLKAARNNNVEKVEELLNKGVDINARDDRGQTALMKAAIFQALDTFQFLLDNGADLWLKTPATTWGRGETREGEDVLQIAKMYKINNIIELIKDHIARQFYEGRKPHFLKEETVNDTTLRQEEIGAKYIKYMKKILSN
jgi:ankyrin repeat protein